MKLKSLCHGITEYKQEARQKLQAFCSRIGTSLHPWGRGCSKLKPRNSSTRFSQSSSEIDCEQLLVANIAHSARTAAKPELVPANRQTGSSTCADKLEAIEKAPEDDSTSSSTSNLSNCSTAAEALPLLSTSVAPSTCKGSSTGLQVSHHTARRSSSSSTPAVVPNASGAHGASSTAASYSTSACGRGTKGLHSKAEKKLNAPTAVAAAGCSSQAHTAALVPSPGTAAHAGTEACFDASKSNGSFEKPFKHARVASWLQQQLACPAPVHGPDAMRSSNSNVVQSFKRASITDAVDAVVVIDTVARSEKVAHWKAARAAYAEERNKNIQAEAIARSAATIAGAAAKLQQMFQQQLELQQLQSAVEQYAAQEKVIHAIGRVMNNAMDMMTYAVAHNHKLFNRAAGKKSTFFWDGYLAYGVKANLHKHRKDISYYSNSSTAAAMLAARAAAPQKVYETIPWCTCLPYAGLRQAELQLVVPVGDLYRKYRKATNAQRQYWERCSPAERSAISRAGLHVKHDYMRLVRVWDICTMFRDDSVEKARGHLCFKDGQLGVQLYGGRTCYSPVEYKWCAI